MRFRAFMNILLDSVLPRRERELRTESRSLEDIPIAPGTHELLGTRILTVMDYREPAVEEVLQTLKYDASGHAAKLLANILEDFLREELSAIRVFSKRRIVLIPVPLYPERERERGFNQIERILAQLPREFRNGRLSTLSSSLIRSRPTKQQTHLSREERLRNVADAFALHDATALQDAHVILIDDIATTGATLSEAAKPFVAAKIPVLLLALARA